MPSHWLQVNFMTLVWHSRSSLIHPFLHSFEKDVLNPYHILGTALGSSPPTLLYPLSSSQSSAERTSHLYPPHLRSSLTYKPNTILSVFLLKLFLLLKIPSCLVSTQITPDPSFKSHPPSFTQKYGLNPFSVSPSLLHQIADPWGTQAVCGSSLHLCDVFPAGGHDLPTCGKRERVHIEMTVSFASKTSKPMVLKYV